ncbi:MAG TPA: helix-hairpin-helix domain-containing protein [Candidatus Paceibacterota bacterium]|nr:helix-hairpin-helix domain-containing protein [Candidatus Paceibacterota bacterium]
MNSLVLKIAAAFAAGIAFTAVVSNLHLVEDKGREFLSNTSALFKEAFLPEERFVEVAEMPLGQEKMSDEAIERLKTKKFAVAPVTAECVFASATAPVADRIIMNEIAWMGNLAGFDKEWIELKNISEKPADISGFRIYDKDEQIKIFFTKGTVVPAGDFLLLERGKDYAGNLRNAEEALRLFDGDCNLVDEVTAEPNWPAGDNKKKFTMERDADGKGWHTSSVEEGTPGRENSAPVPDAPPVVSGERTAPSPATTLETQDFVATNPALQSTAAPSVPGKININTAGLVELQGITGVGPIIAQRILDYRTTNGPFRKIEDLKNVRGIGDTNFEKMRDEISI